MICHPLRKDTRHAAAAAVVGMRDACCSFQADEVGQNTLKLGVKVKASTIGTASKASPAPLPKPSAVRKRSPVVGAVVCRQKGPSPEALK